jgi:hypothetical protein
VPIRKHHLNIGYIELNMRSEPSKPHMSELAYNGAPSPAQVNRLGWSGVQRPELSGQRIIWTESGVDDWEEDWIQRGFRGKPSIPLTLVRIKS